jgi:hypothetical protein
VTYAVFTAALELAVETRSHVMAIDVATGFTHHVTWPLFVTSEKRSKAHDFG